MTNQDIVQRQDILERMIGAIWSLRRADVPHSYTAGVVWYCMVVVPGFRGEISMDDEVVLEALEEVGHGFARSEGMLEDLGLPPWDAYKRPERLETRQRLSYWGLMVAVTEREVEEAEGNSTEPP